MIYFYVTFIARATWTLTWIASVMRNKGNRSRDTKAILAMALVCAAFAKADAMDVSQLKGRWTLEAIDGVSLAPDKEEVYFEISSQTITGYDGCNRFGSSINQPTPAQRGQRGCPSDAVPLPLDFSNLAAQLDQATVDGNSLSLPLPGGKGMAHFKRRQ